MIRGYIYSMLMTAGYYNMLLRFLCIRILRLILYANEIALCYNIAAGYLNGMAPVIKSKSIEYRFEDD